MAKNLNFYFDNDGIPRARGKHSEKLLMSFLETDVQGSDYICHDLMNDLTAIEDESADSREFIGNAHSVNISADGVTITNNIDDIAPDTSTSDESNVASSLEVEYKTVSSIFEKFWKTGKRLFWTKKTQSTIQCTCDAQYLLGLAQPLINYACQTP